METDEQTPKPSASDVLVAINNYLEAEGNMDMMSTIYQERRATLIEVLHRAGVRNVTL